MHSSHLLPVAYLLLRAAKLWWHWEKAFLLASGSVRLGSTFRHFVNIDWQQNTCCATGWLEPTELGCHSVRHEWTETHKAGLQGSGLEKSEDSACSLACSFTNIRLAVILKFKQLQVCFKLSNMSIKNSIVGIFCLHSLNMVIFQCSCLGVNTQNTFQTAFPYSCGNRLEAWK